MPSGTGDFELTTDELRVVARYAVESAQEVLPIFEGVSPEDLRPRAAIDAAWVFVNGGPRTRLQRVAALGSHRAAKEVDNEAARHAAQAAGDAAAAAYLHPLAKATQVGHILRATANAAHAAELAGGDDAQVTAVRVEKARQLATPTLINVLRRYPEAPAGTSRVAQLMKTLDTSLRALR